MEKQNYAMLDIAKFISALLVIAIHCAPFIQISESINFVYVQIVARLAVPFFFITSGFLFFKKIDISKGWKDVGNVLQLKKYWLRIFKIYVLWCILYIPLLAVQWMQSGFQVVTMLRLIRDFFINGMYYHLWFLPALLLAIPIVYMLSMLVKKHTLLFICIALYSIGMVINIYSELLLQQPILGSLLHIFQGIFVTSRNGLFFGPVFITLGIYALDYLQNGVKLPIKLSFMFSFLLLCVEAFVLRQFHIMHDLVSMYAMLIPCVFFLFLLLLQVKLEVKPVYLYLRQMSLLIYVSHIYFIYIFLQILHLDHLLVYVFSMISSCMFSYVIIKVSKKMAFLRVLY